MRHCPRHSGRLRRRRRGSLYIIVLGCAALVALIGLTGAVLNRMEMQRLEATSDAAQARMAAQAAIQMGLRIVRTQSNWRSRGQGVWVHQAVLGQATCTLRVSDPADGDLLDDSADPVVLEGEGRCGEARYIASARLVTRRVGLGALGSSLHVSDNINLPWTGVFSSSAPLTSNQAISASGMDVYAPVSCVGAINGGTYHSSAKSGAPPVGEPSFADFSPYVLGGTAISIWSLPYADGYRVITHTVLSPTSNPYGTANERGLYVIDCQWGKVSIEDCRIVGTLVLLNCDLVRLTREVNWSPAISNWPALLVDGDAELDLTGDQLSEATEGVNFNPAGAPYGGKTDTDKTDSYPCRIEGLICVSDMLEVDNVSDNRVEGTIMARRLNFEAGGRLLIDYDPRYLHAPPPGFESDNEMEYQPRSQEKVVDK